MVCVLWVVVWGDGFAHKQGHSTLTATHTTAALLDERTNARTAEMDVDPSSPQRSSKKRGGKKAKKG